VLRDRRRPWVAGAVAAGLLVAGCTPEDVDASHTAGRPIEPGASYVSFGDSYTAAAFTGPHTDTSDGCWRSDGNYPHLLAAELELDLTDVSCGGATTENLEETQERTLRDAGPRPPQLDALTEDTDLVTLSFGGNDFGLIADLISGCVLAGVQDPDGSPCADSRAAKLDRRVARVRGRLVEGIGAITERAPDARILLVSYPRIYPPEGGCANLRLADGDLGYARRVVELLVDAQAAAAAEANVEFVDAYTPSAGHDLCADDPWVAGHTVEREGRATPYHPYPEEQQLVADLLTEALAR
jgi:lysophospholipase L1-like esterase